MTCKEWKNIIKEKSNKLKNFTLYCNPPKLKIIKTFNKQMIEYHTISPEKTKNIFIADYINKRFLIFY